MCFVQLLSERCIMDDWKQEVPVVVKLEKERNMYVQ